MRADKLQGHPFANAFPMIEGRERIAFKADIAEHGVREQIVLFDDKVLDGRNRLRNGIEAGRIPADADPFTHPAFRLFGSRPTDGDDPFKFVISLNLDGRRHLSESQRALVGANLETLGPNGVPRAGTDANLQRSRAEIAEIVNVSERSMASARKVIDLGVPELVQKVEQGAVAVSVAEKLARLPQDQQAKIIAATSPDRLKTAVKQATRDLVEKRLANKQLALPTEQFGVIYADPPWQWQPYSPETGMEKAAENHYPTLATEEIKKLGVGTIAASDCVLFLWATAPMLCDAMSVMRFWGFAYQTHFIWDKVKIAPGYWNRNRHELLLIGTRGAIPCPAPGTQYPSILVEASRGHSRKPDIAYEMIEAHYPNLPKIELNARRARAGWDAWGLEAPEATGEEIAQVGSNQAAVDADLEEQEQIELRASAAHEGAAVAGESAAQVEEVAKDASSTDQTVTDFYAAGGPRLIARLCEATGLTPNQIKGIAKRLKLTSKARLSASVAESNKRRGQR